MFFSLGNLRLAQDPAPLLCLTTDKPTATLTSQDCFLSLRKHCSAGLPLLPARHSGTMMVEPHGRRAVLYMKPEDFHILANKGYLLKLRYFASLTFRYVDPLSSGKYTQMHNLRRTSLHISEASCLPKM